MMSKRYVSLFMTVIFTVLLLLAGCPAAAAEQNTEHLEWNTEEKEKETESESETSLPSMTHGTEPTASSSTQPTTEKIEPAEFPALTVNAVSNFFPNASAEYNVKTKQVEVTYWFKSSLDLMSVQWYLKYDGTLLTLSEEKNTVRTVCPTIGDKGVLTLDDGYAHYCSSNVRLYDFSKEEKPFARFVFDVAELDEDIPEILTVDLTVDMLVVSDVDAKNKLTQPELEVVLVANEGLNEKGINDVRLFRKTVLTESNFVQATTAPPTTVPPVTDESGNVINTPDEAGESTEGTSTVPTASTDATSHTSKATHDSVSTSDDGNSTDQDNKPKEADKGVVSTGAPIYSFICLSIFCVATSVLFVMRKKEILFN